MLICHNSNMNISSCLPSLTLQHKTLMYMYCLGIRSGYHPFILKHFQFGNKSCSHLTDHQLLVNHLLCFADQLLLNSPLVFKVPKLRLDSQGFFLLGLDSFSLNICIPTSSLSCHQLEKDSHVYLSNIYLSFEIQD